MSTSIETQWQSQRERRRRLAKVILILCLTIAMFGVVSWFWITQPLLSRPESGQTVAVDTARLETDVRAFSEQMSPRDQTHPQNIDRAAAYIQARLAETGGRVSEQPFTVSGTTYRNVICSLGPQSNERIVVGAHYDSYHEYPAADDNASGVAGLIELARLLSGIKLQLQVDLVAYTLEEPPYFGTPHMGSVVHAQSLRRAGVSVKAMLTLEMIGYFSDAPDSQSFPVSLLRAFYPSRGNFIAVVGSLGQSGLVRRVKRAMMGSSSLPVYSINAPRFVPGVDFSDHLSYWNAGYDALMITDTAFYRNHNYHTANDTPEKLDYRRMAMVVAGVFGAVIDLSSSE
ncbi:MAG TPA: M28 family peptidase [Pyrinomonadaceae bacterium]|nr:M28 family peptidase [Pyrinomonadaceae bacterium]